MTNFKDLHYQEKPLLIGNVWDVISARQAENAGFGALGTSSAAVAAQRGYPDGEAMPFAEVVRLVEQISRHCALPLTVDLEGGYSRVPRQIVDNIKQLVDRGAVGINLEDSVVAEDRQLLPADLFAQTLLAIKNELAKRRIDVFLNVRTDTFLLNHSNALLETQSRAQRYQEAGADGLFVPGIKQESDIRSVVQSTLLPINVMSVPGLPDFPTLKQLGVRRISTGNLLFDCMHQHLARQFDLILNRRSFQPIFEYAY